MKNRIKKNTDKQESQLLHTNLKKLLKRINFVMRYFGKIPTDALTINDESILGFARTRGGRLIERIGMELARIERHFEPDECLRKEFGISFETWAEKNIFGGLKAASVYIQLHNRIEDARSGTEAGKLLSAQRFRKTLKEIWESWTEEPFAEGDPDFEMLIAELDPILLRIVREGMETKVNGWPKVEAALAEAQNRYHMRKQARSPLN